ncbi:MAG TPA: type II toxin-antitoxin system VapC family toxin [Terracidiphilus sp.]|jgi:predicted nucleic-acid-binding protein|nr:type II toxin-antitoxin system VapC family toxin [Terracidiphilus sp.]
MKITVDTNILVRAVVRDDPKQAAAAAKALRDSEIVAVTLPCLCEFAWVLRRVYRFRNDQIALAIEALLESSNVQTDRQAINVGLSALKSGGDFADGIIAHEGRWLGGETFVSFDKQAVSLVASQGEQARLLS